MQEDWQIAVSSQQDTTRVLLVDMLKMGDVYLLTPVIARGPELTVPPSKPAEIEYAAVVQSEGIVKTATLCRLLCAYECK